MIKIYYVPRFRETRESKLIKQGLVNNPRIELVDSEKESDFVFQFYYIGKHKKYYSQTFPPNKTVIIDYHDNPRWMCPIKHLAYFKRSWVEMVDKGDYTVKEPISRPPNFYPLVLAIMDEFIIGEDIKRDVMLSCTLRRKNVKRNANRIRILEFIERMDIQGKTQIGQFNRGIMGRFDGIDMREYFRLLRRSRIVVTCNPGKWEGDHRTWETFANGALVFVDRMWTPLTHPLIDGKHCIFYELSNRGLEELREKILYFLQNPTQSDTIAKAGHEFTMKHHRASNRIDEILERIT